MYSRFLQITLLLFCFVKYPLIQSAVLMCNDRCADRPDRIGAGLRADDLVIQQNRDKRYVPESSAPQRP